jgi:hypothetical protein
MRWGVIPCWWSKPLKEMKMATCTMLITEPNNRAVLNFSERTVNGQLSRHDAFNAATLIRWARTYRLRFAPYFETLCCVEFTLIYWQG